MASMDPQVEITILVDNHAEFLSSSGCARRFNRRSLLAEHGFSALVHLRDAGERILWDAGTTTIALPENMRRLDIDPTTITRVALSHGHLDHYAAMTEVLKSITAVEPRDWGSGSTAEEIRRWVEERPQVPLVAHPAAFRERWVFTESGRKLGPRTAPRAEWEAAGARIVLSEGPYELAPACWLTGAVPRRSFEQAGTSPRWFYRQGDEFVRDYVDDDQAIAVDVKGKGLVVLSGCAHSGILNTIERAREVSGAERVYAVLGGFHLGTANEEEIERTIDALRSLAPAVIVPTHCSGFPATAELARRMPEQFVLGVVGTTYSF